MTYKTAKVYSGTEWVDIAVSVSDATQRVVTEIGVTTYTLVIGDAGKALVFTNSSPTTLTIPLESSVNFSIGQTLVLIQKGTGQVTVAGAVGVTVRSSGSKTKISTQYGEARLIKIASNEWLLSGDLSV
jgi:hypothetical protein